MNPPNRFGGCPARRPQRVVESSGSSRSPMYLDDDAIHRMIESFGPLEYTQFTMPCPSLGDNQFGTPEADWLDTDWGPPPESMAGGSKRKNKSPRHANASPEPKFLLPQVSPEDEGGSTGSPGVQESILEWFDRSVERELKKRREATTTTTGIVDPALAPLKAKHAMNLSRGTMEKVAETGASGVEIATQLESDYTTELLEAVDKLAKAENMVSYVEALVAAEEASKDVPPELVEQAAAAGARGVKTEISEVNETFGTGKPIEVVGYVGVTKPRLPKKSNRNPEKDSGCHC